MGILTWGIRGALFGLTFPAIAFGLTHLQRKGYFLGFTGESVYLGIIALAPLVLGLMSAWLGYQVHLVRLQERQWAIQRASQSAVWAQAAAEAAHEINNPLAIVDGILSRYTRGLENHTHRNYIKDLETVQTQVDRIAKAVVVINENAALASAAPEKPLNLGELTQLAVSLAHEKTRKRLQLFHKPPPRDFACNESYLVAFALVSLLMSIFKTCPRNRRVTGYLSFEDTSGGLVLRIWFPLLKPEPNFIESVALPRTILRSVGHDLRRDATTPDEITVCFHQVSFTRSAA